VFATYDVLEQFDDDIDIADGYTVGARVQWTIFDGGAAVARARQSETDIQIDEVAFANQRNAVRLEVEQAFFDLQANEENIATSEKAVELAEESLRLARLRFQAGVGTQTDVIQAQTELTTARGNFLTAIINYNQSLNELQRAVDSLTETRLASETEN
jgi:outer membrane protein TolC